MLRTRTRLLLVVASLALTSCTTVIDGTAAGTATRLTQSAAAPSASSSPAPGPSRPSGSQPSASPTAVPAGDGPIRGPVPRPSPGVAGAGVIPAGFEEFYRQKLDWQACPSFNDNADDVELFAVAGLECANLIAPLSYADPAGPTVSIAVLRSPATGDRVGALPMNPGGPGGSGIAFVAAVADDEEWATLHESFDFVGFDPRGVGASRPRMTCFSDLEQDAARAANNRTTTAAGIAATTALSADYVAECRARTGADQGIDGAAFLASIGTDDVVRDMDVLRSVLGEEKLTYLGFSYGTLIGQGYAAQFPQNVRALLLDGVVDPAKGPVALDLGQAEGFQTVFDAFAAWCAPRTGCALGPDADQAVSVYQRLTRPLLDDPLPLADGRTMTYIDAIGGTFTALYADTAWPTLNKSLQDLQQGDGNLLMALADLYLERDSDGHYGAGNDVYNAVRCVDNPRVPVDDAVVEKYDAAAPFQDSGDPQIAVPTPWYSNPHDFLCTMWPVQPAGLTVPTSGAGLPTLLVISTTHDPATPYEDGVRVADLLDARLLTVEGDQHTAYLSAASPCVDDAGTAYLVDLTLPISDLTCG